MHTRLSTVAVAAHVSTAETHQQRQERKTSRYLEMARAALAAKPSAAPGEGAGALPAADHGTALGTDLPRVRTVQEIGDDLQANREERRRSHEKARREAEATCSPQEFPESVREAYSASARVVVRRQVHVRQVQDRQPQREQGPSVPKLEELLDLAGLRPKRGRGAGTEGAGRLARLFDLLARYVLKARGYRVTPSQVVFHMSQELLAKALKVNVKTVRRWTDQLEALGYCHSRPHFSNMTQDGETVTAVDGMLYAVRLQGGHRAHLSYDDLAHHWRDLDADRKAGRTAWAILKAAQKQEEQEQEKARQESQKNMPGSTSPTHGGAWLQVLKDWAVTPGTHKNPLEDDPGIFPPAEPRTVQDVVYALPLVLDAHPTKRAALVGMLGATLARQLRDQHSRRWYCRLIWDAYAASVEGRAGLQQLAAQLARLDADRREWGGLRNPAALLAARLRYPSAVQA